MVCGKKLGWKFFGSRLVEPHFLIRNYCSPTVMRLLNSFGCCWPSSDERQLLSPLLQSRMSLRGLVAIGWCLYGDGEDGGVDAGTVMIIAFCRDSNDRARQLSVAISIATIDTLCILVFWMLVYRVTGCCCDFAAVVHASYLSAWYFRTTTGLLWERIRQLFEHIRR